MGSSSSCEKKGGTCYTPEALQEKITNDGYIKSSECKCSHTGYVEESKYKTLEAELNTLKNNASKTTTSTEDATKIKNLEADVKKWKEDYDKLKKSSEEEINKLKQVGTVLYSEAGLKGTDSKVLLAPLDSNVSDLLASDGKTKLTSSKVNSLHIAPYTEVWIYKEANFKGECAHFHNGKSDYYDFSVSGKWINAVSSIRIRSCPSMFYDNQQYLQFHDMGILRDVLGKKFMIYCGGDNTYAIDDTGSYADGTNIYIRQASTTNTNQMFYVNPRGQILCSNDKNKCFYVSSTASGTKLAQKTASSVETDNKSWWCLEYNGGRLSVADQFDKTLDVWGGSFGDRIALAIHDTHGGKNQRFFINNLEAFTILDKHYSEKDFRVILTLLVVLALIFIATAWFTHLNNTNIGDFKIIGDSGIGV